MWIFALCFAAVMGFGFFCDYMNAKPVKNKYRRLYQGDNDVRYTGFDFPDTCVQINTDIRRENRECLDQDVRSVSLP